MRRPPRRRPRVFAAGVAAMLAATTALSGCSLRTVGAPTGSLTVTATFDDAQGLVSGHSVKMSDVPVGSVTKVELVRGYRSRATLSIKDDVRLPANVRAEIKVTSLLGENYVDLMLPPGGRLDAGPYLRSGAAIADTSVQPAFEQVVGQAGPLLEALAGNDIATVVNAGATALEGNGQKLNATLAKSAELMKMLAEQRRVLGRAVDDFARLGRSLAAAEDELARAPGELQRASKVLRDNKGRILDAATQLTKMSRELNDRVLERRVVRLRTMLKDLDPVLAQLGTNRARLTQLVDGLVNFTDKLPKASWDGQLLLYPVLRLTWPDGTPILPEPGGGRSGTEQPKTRKKPEEPRKQQQQQKPAPPAAQPPGNGIELPEDFRRTFPELARILEGR